MDRVIVFAVFGSVVSVGSLVCVYLISRSNRRFLKRELENEKLNKQLASHT